MVENTLQFIAFYRNVTSKFESIFQGPPVKTSLTKHINIHSDDEDDDDDKENEEVRQNNQNKGTIIPKWLLYSLDNKSLHSFCITSCI